MIKEGDSRAAKHYIKAANDNHLAAGHEWSSILARPAWLFGPGDGSHGLNAIASDVAAAAGQKPPVGQLSHADLP